MKRRIADALYKFGRQVDEVLYGRDLAVARYYQEQIERIQRGELTPDEIAYQLARSRYGRRHV